MPLPHSHFDGEEGFRKNLHFLAGHRMAVGPDYPLMVDCYMSLTVNYAIRLAEAAKPLNIHWWEEVLSPEDNDGWREIKRAHPTLKWTTAEHEYTRYGFRQLIAERAIDILQPDVMWVGGLTETLRIAAHAAAYDTPVVPHGSGPYSYHFIASQTRPRLLRICRREPGRQIDPARVRRPVRRRARAGQWPHEAWRRPGFWDGATGSGNARADELMGAHIPGQSGVL